MFNENLKVTRKSKGISQEELAIKLHVVRQTVSKWEKGHSVPDSDTIIAISEILDTPVSVLLGPTIEEDVTPDDLKVISEKLEIINLQFAQMKRTRMKILFWIFVAVTAAILIVGTSLILLNSPYQNWDYSDPEVAVFGAIYHAFEFIFMRIAPFALIGTVIGIIVTSRKL